MPVSHPAPSQHHFANKDGLREACDTYVSNQLRRGVAENVTRESTGDTEAPATDDLDAATRKPTFRRETLEPLRDVLLSQAGRHGFHPGRS